jgi:alanyl-tRNA synthetase
MIGDKKALLKEVRYINNRIAPAIMAPVDLKVGMKVTSVVDSTWRTKAMKNHTATHMLQAALIQLFGHTIKQSGSLVHPDYLRFDFTYHENLSADDIKRVEDLVNQKIMDDIPVTTEYTTMKDALARGALAFFGDKYNPEQVRIVDIPNYSAELCGGTHVPRTGVIGSFKIVEVTALSAGHRRIFAVTGPKALELFQESFNTVKTLSQEFSVQRDQVTDTVLKQKEQIKELHKEIKLLRADAWRAHIPQWQQEIESINGVPFSFVHAPEMDAQTLREIVNHLADKKPGLYFAISEHDGRASFVCRRSEQFADRVDLKKFATWLNEEHELRGGGQRDTLQGGGSKFDANLKQSMSQWVKKNS